MDYLTWTFFFRRLLQNPSYYDLPGTEQPVVNQYLSDIIQTTLEDLQASFRCIDANLRAVLRDAAALAPYSHPSNCSTLLSATALVRLPLHAYGGDAVGGRAGRRVHQHQGGRQRGIADHGPHRLLLLPQAHHHGLLHQHPQARHGPAGVNITLNLAQSHMLWHVTSKGTCVCVCVCCVTTNQERCGEVAGGAGRGVRGVGV